MHLSNRLLGISLIFYFIALCFTQIPSTSDSAANSEAFQADSTTETSFRISESSDKLEPSTENNGISTFVTNTDKGSTTKLPTDISAISLSSEVNLKPGRDRLLSDFTTIHPETTTSDVLKKWQDFENITKIFMKDAVKRMLPGLMEGTGNMNISDTCRRDVLRFIIGLREIKAWAFSFIDASGKFIDGMLSGTMANIGEYDQCLDIKVKNEKRGKNFGKVLFTGKYCALDLKPPIPPKKRYYKLNDVVEELKEFSEGGTIISEAAKSAQFFQFISMRLGLCVPSGCHPSDIQQVIDKVAEFTRWDVKVNRCEVYEDNNYTPLIIGVMTAMSFFGFLLVVGSLVDLYHMYAQKKISNIMLETFVCFSLVSNFKKLVNTKNAKGNMSCLNGVRFLSISWVVLGHTYLNTNYVLGRGLKKATQFQTDFFFQAVVNASVAVDTFFFIGGLLVCYVAVKLVIVDKKKFSVFLYILHRIFRLLPVYIMIIVFIYLAPILGSGPMYHDVVDGFVNNCYKNWWTNIIFLNNFINTNEICLPQSWYVACDMQLYIASLIVLLPIFRWPRVGISIAVLGIMASVIGTMVMTYVYEYPPTMLFVHPDIEQRLAYWANAYFKPYSHAAPYCIGLITGYILATRPKLKFPLVVRIIGWCSAIICTMSVLYGVYDWNKGKDPELAETLLYSGLHRVAWTAGIAWMIVCCSIGQGGVINYILSWKIWVPLGRLTYCIYLIHPIVQIAALGNVRMQIMTTHYFAIWIYFGHLMITIGSSFCASMLVEAPFIALEKIFLRAIVGKEATSSSSNGHASTPNDSTRPKTITSGENGTTETNSNSRYSNHIRNREFSSDL